MTRLLLPLILLGGTAASLRAGVDINVNIGAPPYYGYGPREVVYVERYIPDYDVPRVFVVSRYARVAPSVVVGLYRGGWGWNRICDRYGVPFEVVIRGGRGYGYGPGYYGAPPRVVYGPPYGHAYGHYKGKKWKHHRRGRDWDDD